MSGVSPRYSVDAPITYTVKSDQAVTGGQLVEVVTGGVVQPASAGSATVVGVATKNARGTYNPYGTTGEGDFLMDASGVGNQVAVERGYFKVTFAANTTVGAKLKAAANGQVTPWVSGTDGAEKIVGECAEAAGVTSGGVGLARIY
ncbi:scaffolding protein [Streptomyces phage LazerLemon]|nr:scaffolding protein [Streptomyces phage LazerLemon]